MFAFGSGALFAVPLGTGDTTPQQFGILQEATIDITRAEKELHGRNQMPEVVAAGKQKVTVKAKHAAFNANMWNLLFFGQTIAAGRNQIVTDEAGTVPAVLAFTITVSGSATFSSDLGVRYTATGAPLKKVASAPAIGEYSVAAGVYTFAAGDASAAVLISYVKTAATVGQSTTLANKLVGTAPTFEVHFDGQYADTNKHCTIRLPKCIATKISLATKTEDFVIPDFEATAMVDSAGNWMYIGSDS